MEPSGNVAVHITPGGFFFEVGKHQQHGYAADVYKGGRDDLFL